MTDTSKDQPTDEPAAPRRPKPLDETALAGVAGGKIFFDDGVTTFWDPATGQVTNTPPGG
jgi:hypothetical protein